MIDIIDALHSLKPNAIWTYHHSIENFNDALIWQDETQTKPTESEIQAEITRLQTEYEANEYQRKRESEYPSFADQFDLLYHGGYDVWKTKIDEIKSKYPKPESN